MQLSTIWQQLGRVQQEIRHGSRKTQDTAIAALQDGLADHHFGLFPSFVYPLLTDVLRFYCRMVLPELGLCAEDQRYVRDGFEQTVSRLQADERVAQQLEADFKEFLGRVKSGEVEEIEEVITTFGEMLMTPRLSSGASRRVCFSACSEFQTPGDSLRSTAGVLGVSKVIEKSYRAIRHAPFTAKHVIPLFDNLLHETLPQEYRERFADIHDLFQHQLQECVQMKAVLVNTTTQRALITRLDVTTALESGGFDTLEFENTVDDRMYESCWNAMQAARVFLEEHFPGLLNRQSLCVSCRFPNPIVGYNDTSASLLVCLKIIGDVLDLEIDPRTVVSGAVDVSGKVLAVVCIPEKVLAAQQHPKIQRVLLPADGLFMSSQQVEILGARDLSDALTHYYGEPFQLKLRQVSRRKFLKNALTMAAVPFAPLVFSAFRNIFSHPVSDHDLHLLECARDLYTRNSDYHSATIILQSILHRFQNDKSSTEVVRLKACALWALGIIYLQQDRQADSLAAFHQAYDLWKAIHERQNQVDMLLRIGEVYRYSVASDGLRQNGRLGLRYYRQAAQLLRPSMKRYSQLHGQCYALQGYLYYWLDEGELAEQYTSKGLEALDAVDTDWVYQTVSQYRGQALVSVGKYDEAHDMLYSASHAAVLQSPYYRARSWLAKSELCLCVGDVDEGLDYAGKSRDLCHEFDLHGQQRMLAQVLAKYQLQDFDTRKSTTPRLSSGASHRVC